MSIVSLLMVPEGLYDKVGIMFSSHTGYVIRLPHANEVTLRDMGNIDCYLTTIKHNKVQIIIHRICSPI